MEFFKLSKLFWLFAQPGNFLVLLLVAGLVLDRLHRRQAAHVLMATATIALFAILLLPLGQWLARPLEDRFPPAALPACVSGVLVLSGGEDSRVADSRDTPVASDGGKYAVVMQLMHRYPDAQFVFSGGDPNPVQQDGPQSDVAALFFRDLGVAKDRILYEDKSRNTWENFIFTQRLVRPEANGVWLLVTPALHMPRSIGVARQAGWDMIPVPTDYRTPGLSYGATLHFSAAEGLQLADDAVKEWIGLVVYRLTGRSTELLPAPRSTAAPDCSKIG